MITTAAVHKPKITKAGGIWFVSDGSGVTAQGATAKDAFRAYKQTRKVMNRWGIADPGLSWGRDHWRIDR